MTERRLFRYEALRTVPGWLRGTVGGALMQAIGMQLDDLADRAADALMLRFPSGDRPEALGPLGRDRRIKRGPAETSEAFAERLRGWWDAHRTRGNAYTLLRQIWLRSGGNMGVAERVDLVYHSGARRWLDANDGEIHRDSIEWNADGTGLWAQAWIVYHSEFDFSILDPFPAEFEEELKATPRDWSPAHLLPMHVVVIWDGVELWGYPPGGTWAEDDPEPGQVWPENDPVIFQAE